MANKFFDEARQAVNNIANRAGQDQQQQIDIAKNVLQSARANSNTEEQQQLQQLQQQIEEHEQGLK